MRLPITTDELDFIVATPPRPMPPDLASVALAGEGAPFTLDVLATSGTAADVVAVQVHERLDVSVGDAVRVHGLTVEYWEAKGRSGACFRASAVERIDARGTSPEGGLSGIGGS